ncbi:MAG: ABC transporter substrate-binding protein [Candidatus Daviesbacteria bacterium]|nr:ABC transporter substrate-binding protein [Candidatus Daviesbacteria bacterium]
MPDLRHLQKSLKITYLVALTYVRRHSSRVFLGLLLISLAIFFQLKFNILNFSNNSVSEGLVGTYQEHDLPTELTKLASRPLVDVDETGRVIPAIAKSWEVNSDATNYKFILSDGAKWVTGEPIKAQDIEISIPNAIVSTPDDRTLEFKLKESYSAFPSLLTKPVFKKGTILGTGPYKIEKVEKSRIFITKIVLEPVTNNLPKVTVRFYPNEKTALTGFALGEIQSILGLTDSMITGNSDLESPLIKQQTRVDYTKIVGVFYNTKDAVLSNRSLRQTLSFAAPVITGTVEANNPYPPRSWAVSQDSKDYLNNPDEAKSALDRAKVNSSAELLSKELVLTTTSALEKVGQEIILAWRNLGINAVLRVESGIPQQFQALLITQSIPSDPDQYFLWHETQKETNLTQYDQKRVDKDLEDGRKLIKEDDRKQAYLDFQKVLLEDAPATFMYFPKYNIVYLKKAESKLNQILPLQFSALVK